MRAEGESRREPRGDEWHIRKRTPCSRHRLVSLPDNIHPAYRYNVSRLDASFRATALYHLYPSPFLSCPPVLLPSPSPLPSLPPSLPCRFPSDFESTVFPLTSSDLMSWCIFQFYAIFRRITRVRFLPLSLSLLLSFPASSSDTWASLF